MAPTHDEPTGKRAAISTDTKFSNCSVHQIALYRIRELVKRSGDTSSKNGSKTALHTSSSSRYHIAKYCQCQ